MLIYVPTHKTEAESWELSSQLWQDTDPPPSSTTLYLYPVEVHPQTGDCYFRLTEAQAMALGYSTAAVDGALSELPLPDEEA